MSRPRFPRDTQGDLEHASHLVLRGSRGGRGTGFYPDSPSPYHGATTPRDREATSPRDRASLGKPPPARRGLEGLDAECALPIPWHLDDAYRNGEAARHPWPWSPAVKSAGPAIERAPRLGPGERLSAAPRIRASKM